MKLEVYDDILFKLINDKLSIHDKIPSINSLAQKYGCSSTTIKNTLNTMVILGILNKRQGSGYFINKYWSANLLTSPLEKQKWKNAQMVAYKINDETFEKYKDLFNKYFDFSKTAWKKYIKFYYTEDKSKVICINFFLVKESLIMNYDFEIERKHSLIKWLYANKKRKISETTNISARVCEDVEAEILMLKKSDIVIIEDTVTKMSGEPLFISHLIYDPFYFSSTQHKFKL